MLTFIEVLQQLTTDPIIKARRNSWDPDTWIQIHENELQFWYIGSNGTPKFIPYSITPKEMLAADWITIGDNKLKEENCPCFTWGGIELFTYEDEVQCTGVEGLFTAYTKVKWKFKSMQDIEHDAVLLSASGHISLLKTEIDEIEYYEYYADTVVNSTDDPVDTSVKELIHISEFRKELINEIKKY